MKKIAMLLLAAFTVVGTVSVVQAQHNHQKEQKGKKMYECPMKCEPASDKPGKCSKCGMKLKEITVEAKMYQCPMKCEPATDKPGKCGKCGMNLKEIKPAAVAMYECPMKCEPASDKPGKCGVCGMNLKKKA